MEKRELDRRVAGGRKVGRWLFPLDEAEEQVEFYFDWSELFLV